ncbi:hypothetical protein STENM327S_01099 [Streptomyces tendae]
MPRSFADSVLREHSGPAGRQPEYFVDTQQGVDILNAGFRAYFRSEMR